jgi:hypothetical protein
MKTLQEQFNLIQEGKGHKDMFLKSAKRLFPEYVTNFATYGEATTILKQRGIISEAAGGIVTKRTFDPFKAFNSFVTEEVKAEEKKTSKDVEDLQTRTAYDNTNYKNIDNLYGEEFLEGYYAEMKDPKNADKTVDELKEIVRKNLAKNRSFYVENAAFGVKGIGYTKEAPGLGEPKEAKGKYKASGYGDIKK